MSYKTKRISILRIVVVFLGLIVGAFKCKDDARCTTGSHKSILVENTSSNVVVFQYDQPDSLYNPNSSEPFEGIRLESGNNYKLANRDCYEAKYDNSYSDYIMFFNPDTVNKIGWLAVKGTNRGLIKRVRIDLNYLNQNNFTVTYP